MSIRKSAGIRDIKRELLPYIKEIADMSRSKYPGLYTEIAREYGYAVTPFVPRSDKTGAHHLQHFYVSDGRVRWEKHTKSGKDITNSLYDGSILDTVQRKDGQPAYFHIRSTLEFPEVQAHGYGTHRPMAYWDEYVRPGTPQWKVFITNIAPMITEAIKAKED